MVTDALLCASRVAVADEAGLGKPAQEMKPKNELDVCRHSVLSPEASIVEEAT